MSDSAIDWLNVREAAFQGKQFHGSHMGGFTAAAMEEMIRLHYSISSSHILLYALWLYNCDSKKVGTLREIWSFAHPFWLWKEHLRKADLFTSKDEVRFLSFLKYDCIKDISTWTWENSKLLHSCFIYVLHSKPKFFFRNGSCSTTKTHEVQFPSAWCLFNSCHAAWCTQCTKFLLRTI